MDKRTARMIDTIELRFGKIDAHMKSCEVIDITQELIKITDVARGLFQTNQISSADHRKYIERIDNVIDKMSKNCRCSAIRK